MHVYLREEPVHLEMREVDAEGLVPEGSELLPIAFYANGNEQPSFRALLPPETLATLAQAITEPVQLGLLAEEPEDADAEIRAMVGISVPVQAMDPSMTMELEQTDDDAEPWRADPDAWRGSADEEGELEDDGPDEPKTALLAFAPLVRLRRRFPDDFGDELVDLLETALAGVTKPSLQARVDRMLGEG
jgi:hypothetical protein